MGSRGPARAGPRRAPERTGSPTCRPRSRSPSSRVARRTPGHRCAGAPVTAGRSRIRPQPAAACSTPGWSHRPAGPRPSSAESMSVPPSRTLVSGAVRETAVTTCCTVAAAVSAIAPTLPTTMALPSPSAMNFPWPIERTTSGRSLFHATTTPVRVAPVESRTVAVNWRVVADRVGRGAARRDGDGDSTASRHEKGSCGGNYRAVKPPGTPSPLPPEPDPPILQGPTRKAAVHGSRDRHPPRAGGA
jgi:hypothetical protein